MADKKPWERDYGAQPQQGTTFTVDPYAPNAERRAEEDQALERERLRIARENAERDAAKEAREQAEFNQEQAEAVELEQSQATSDRNRLAQISAILDTINRLERRTKDGSGIGSIEGQEDFRTGDRYMGASQFFNQDANSVYGLLEQVQGDMTQQVLAQLVKDNGGTGASGMANTAAEAARMAAAIAPLNQNMEPEEFAAGLRKAREYYQRLQQNLAGEGPPPDLPNKDGELVPAAQIELPRSGDGPGAAGAGATETRIPVPEEMQAEYRAYIDSNWGKIDARDLSRFMTGLETKYNRPVGVPDYTAFVERANEAAAQNAESSVVGPIPETNREMSQLEQLRNEVISNPFGTGATAAINSATLGIPAALAGRERMQAASDLNPGAAFVGDVIGGTAGTLATGGVLGLGAKAVGASGRTGAIMTNPLTADIAYGSTFGALSDDNAIEGALIGGTGALVGDQIGRMAGRGLARLRSPDDPLSQGQRAVVSVAGDETDEIVSALTRADELGVPMTLADTTPRMRALGGISVRHSDETGGLAEKVLFERGQGQFDRLDEAIARDLGPVTNIPQRSEELIKQARAKAGPLYEKAYAAEGASVLDLSDLYGRPSMRGALKQAVDIAREEGVDPNALGFRYNDGNDLVEVAQPSWETLDYVKRGLDDVLEGYRDKTTGRLVLDDKGRAIDATRRELLKRIDNMNPAYGEARAAYAGPAQEASHLARGTKSYTANPDELGVELAKMTPEQQAQMRLGYQSEAVNRAAVLNDSTNPFSRLASPQTRQRLDVLYGDGEDVNIARLLEQVDLERQLAGNRTRMVGGSQTAGREIADQYFQATGRDGMNLPLAIAESAAMGAPFMTVGKSIGDRLLRDRREAAALQANRELATELGPLLFGQSPSASAVDLKKFVAADRSHQDEIAEILANDELRGRLIGTAASAATGDYFAY